MVSAARAARAIAFIETLTYGAGAYIGQPFRLRPWQKRIVRQLFGAVRADGRRQYRQCYLGIPRKNGKTELGAALALYLLIADGEPAAQVYSAAADREGAGLIFKCIANMVAHDKELGDLCKVIASKKEIQYRPTASYYRALSSEAYTKHGLNAHAIVYDELHTAPNRELWDVLTTSQGSRRQPMTMAITTAGYDRTSICYEVYDYARNVAAGVVTDDTFLPVIYEAAESADWTSERVWRKANPALGDFREIDEMRVKARQAINVPSNQNAFRQLYLNQWTEQATRWLDLAAWDAQAGPVLAEADLAGRDCVGGLDIGSVSDLTAWALLFPREDGGCEVLVRCFVPAAQLTRDENPKRWTIYQDWARQGYLTVCPGRTVPDDVVIAQMRADAATFHIGRVHVDALFQGQRLVEDLNAEGFPIYPMRQGFLSMGPAVRAFETRFQNGTIRHGGNPILRWCVSHAVALRDAAGNTKVDKSRPDQKVDPLVALVMGMDALERQPTARSVYEERGILSL